MCLSEEEKKILTCIKNKYHELDVLFRLFKETHFIELLADEKAPSLQLENPKAPFFCDILKAIAKCQLLHQTLNNLIENTLAHHSLSKTMLVDVVELVAELKDTKKSALGNLVNLKNNEAYHKLRKQIGQKNLEQILSTIESSDDLLNSLEPYPIIGDVVERTKEAVKLKSMVREYQRAKQELLETESVFKIDMARLNQANLSLNLTDCLIKFGYPHLARFIKLATRMEISSANMLSIFATAINAPHVLISKKTAQHLQEHYGCLQEAISLKARIDKVEINRFQKDERDKIKCLKLEFLKCDSRGIYSFLGMPFQRLCRYPLLIKSILSAISINDESGTPVASHITELEKEWSYFQAFWMHCKALTAKSNLEQYRFSTELEKIGEWTNACPKQSGSNKSHFFSVRSSLKAENLNRPDALEQSLRARSLNGGLCKFTPKSVNFGRPLPPIPEQKAHAKKGYRPLPPIPNHPHGPLDPNQNLSLDKKNKKL